MASWWEEFKNGLTSEDEIEFARKLDEADKKTTPDKVNKLKKDFDMISFEGATKFKFERKLRIYEKRLIWAAGGRFGPLLRQLRQQRNLSLANLEKMTDVSASYLNSIENGSRKAPSIGMIEALSKALDVDKNILLSATYVTDTKEKTSVDIYDLLRFNDFTIKNHSVSETDKIFFINILTEIDKSQWNSEAKLNDNLKIMNMIDKYKRSKSEKNEQL